MITVESNDYATCDNCSVVPKKLYVIRGSRADDHECIAVCYRCWRTLVKQIKTFTTKES